MSLQLAFWLLVVFGLVVYVVMVRSSSTDVAARRAMDGQTFREKRVVSRERGAALRKTATVRTRPSSARPKAAPTKRSRRRKSPWAKLWPFGKWP